MHDGWDKVKEDLARFRRFSPDARPLAHRIDSLPRQAAIKQAEAAMLPKRKRSRAIKGLRK